MRTPLTFGLGLIVIAPLLLPDVASAQVLDTYLPPLGAGLGTIETEPAQVQALERYAPLGVVYGPVRIDATAAESFGYDNNVDRLLNGKGSPVIMSSGDVAAVAQWTNDQLHAEMNVSDYRFPSQSIQNRTNWTATLGGVHNFGHDQLGFTYTHLSLVQTPMDLGAQLFSVPIQYEFDNAGLSYTLLTHGRFSFIPQAQIGLYDFGQPINNGNLFTDQSYRNRVMVNEGVTARYELTPERQVLVVLQGTEIHYVNNMVAGLPSRDSSGLIAMTGLDFGLTGPFRARALVGYQTRLYHSGFYGTISSPIAELELGWNPTRLTMLSLAVRNGIEDGGYENVVGFTYTTAELTVRHYYNRNLVLTAHGGIQRADYARTPEALDNTILRTIQSQQLIFDAGAGAQWLLNRHVSMTFNYNFTSQNSSDYAVVSDHNFMIGLSFAL